MKHVERDMAGRVGHSIKKVGQGWPLRRWDLKEVREFAEQLLGGTRVQAGGKAEKSPSSQRIARRSVWPEWHGQEDDQEENRLARGETEKVGSCRPLDFPGEADEAEAIAPFYNEPTQDQGI